MNRTDESVGAPDITLRDAQMMVDRWITTVGVRYFSPLTNMAVLTEEVGEVARVMARQYGDQSAKPGDSLALAANVRKKSERDANRHRNNPKLKA